MTKSEKDRIKADLARQLRASGHKQSDIAKLIGVSPQRVSVLVKDVECPVNHYAENAAKARASHARKMQSRHYRTKIIAAQMHGRGQSIEEIAKRIRKSPEWVCEWVLPTAARRLDRKLRRLGVPKADRAPIVEEVRLAA